MDKIVTGIVIWWAAAGIFGLSRTQKWKKIWKQWVEKSLPLRKKIVKNFWKVTAWIITFFTKK